VPRALLSLEDAQRGVYIDFEGARGKPALLGVLTYTDDGEEDFAQFILDEALHPAWVFDPRLINSDIEISAEVLLELVEDPVAPRRLFAWSTYEEDRFRDLLSGTPQVRVADRIANARKLATPWKERHFPEPPEAKPPMGKRNPLSLYLDLIGYQRHPEAVGMQPATGISAMLSDLHRCERVDQISRETASAWRVTLRRNYDDCAGMREVMLRVAGDRPEEEGR
jgi:hypothetical protein